MKELHDAFGNKVGTVDNNGNKQNDSFIIDDSGPQTASNELVWLRALAEQMRLNVENRTRSPKWLIRTLNKIAEAQGVEEVKPGITYGKQVRYD